jgi:cytochrome b6-f complex iron-sulfur subunit
MKRRSFLGVLAAFVWVGCSKGKPKDARLDPGFVRVGQVAAIVDEVRSGSPLYVLEARAYLALFPDDALDDAREVYDKRVISGIEDTGLVALSQKCTHLGCRMPFCEQSKRYECPCHAAIYTPTGDRVGGPAPRGMDRFPVAVIEDILYIDTREVVTGTDSGVDPVGAPAAGPACVGP